jgi:transcriptional regulator with XRE-family HTH domain
MESQTALRSPEMSETPSASILTLLKNAEMQRWGFSERLQEALRNADYAPDSPTELAREFNIRFLPHSITVDEARTWLIGEAIPTQQKLRTLADWLGVSAEWLRFREDDADPMA